MLKEQTRVVNNLNHLMDFILLVAAFLLAYFIRANLKDDLLPMQNYLWTVLVAYPVWVFLFKKYHLYSSIRRRSYFEIAIQVLNAHIVGGAVIGGLIFLLDKDRYSRALFLIFIASSLTVFLIERIGVRYLLGVLRARGYNTRYLLIVGTRAKAAEFHKMVEAHEDWGLKIRGFVQVMDEADLTTVGEHEILGNILELVDICRKNPVDEVVFCLPKDYVIDADEYIRELEELGITVRMVLDFFDVAYSRKELYMFHNRLPILTFHSKSLDAQQLLIKRGLDILGSVVGLGIFVFSFPLIALAIKKDSPGPILFGQTRVGENGREFTCWKFRSMYVDAEGRKKDLMDRNQMNGAIFKIKDDPRITRVGRFLRKTSLDELPQFWNVFRGEMSLVGTRPPTPEEVNQYQNWHWRRISIKPGITGKWQVSGRSSIEDFDEIVRLDIDYIENWSIWLDLKILLQTGKVVLFRDGSC